MNDQKIVDYLADILWWLKGYLAASHDEDTIRGFFEDHIIAIREARIKILKDMEV